MFVLFKDKGTMKRFFTFLLALLPFSLWAMDMAPQSKINQEEYSKEEALFTEVAPGIYAGQTKVGNETVYFGMEKLDEESINDWNNFGIQTNKFTTYSSGLLWFFSTASARSIKISFGEALQTQTGFTKEEYSLFTKKTDEAVQKNPNIPNAIAGIPLGVAGFLSSGEKNYYVVYASRKPVQGRFPFPKDIPSSISLKEYFGYYGDIIMCLGSWDHPPSRIYKNRGIFKNPLSFIIDGNKYPGLSLKLHGFSAVVASYIFRDKQYMVVKPIPFMTRILLGVKGWQRGDVFIYGKDLMDYTPDELEDVKEGKEPSTSNQEEPRFQIKIEALIKLYKGV
jgi:hypothetical protein